MKALKPKQALKLKELKPKEAKSIEYDNYFINGLAETKPIDLDEELSDTFTGNSAPISFNDFEDPMHMLKVYIMVINFRRCRKRENKT